MANGYRKDSIFWALTLIAIGSLFLYTNFHHDVRAWQIIAKYWPVLIIFWGLSKLYGYIRYRRDPNAVQGPFFTAGEIVALIFLLIIGTSISTAVRHSNALWGPVITLDDQNFNIGSFFGNPYDFTDQVETAATPKPAIEIPDVRGDVKVTGWDQPKIQVVVKKRVYADNENDAKIASDFIKTSITPDGGKYRIVTNRQEAANKGYRIQTELQINVPKDSRITTNQMRGAVTLVGLVGDQSIDSAWGDVETDQISGNVVVRIQRGTLKANDVSGNLDVSGRGDDVSVSQVGGSASINGEFYSVALQNIKKQARFLSSRTDLLAEKVDGSIRLESGNLTVTNVNGPFNCKTRDKDISLDNVLGPIQIDNTRGDVRVRAGSPPKSDIGITNQSAAIELDLPSNASFQINGATKSGDIESDFKEPSLKITSDQPTNEITGTVGRGGPRFRLSTTYGDIKVRQR